MRISKSKVWFEEKKQKKKTEKKNTHILYIHLAHSAAGHTGVGYLRTPRHHWAHTVKSLLDWRVYLTVPVFVIQLKL